MYVQTFSKMSGNNTGIAIFLSLHLKVLTFPREEDVLKSLVFRGFGMLLT